MAEIANKRGTCLSRGLWRVGDYYVKQVRTQRWEIYRDRDTTDYTGEWSLSLTHARNFIAAAARTAPAAGYIESQSGPGYTPRPRPQIERNVYTLHSLAPTRTGEEFTHWAAGRGMKVSTALRALVNHALYQEALGEPLGPLQADLPPATLDQIVTALQERRQATSA